MDKFQRMINTGGQGMFHDPDVQEFAKIMTQNGGTAATDALITNATTKFIANDPAAANVISKNQKKRTRRSAQKRRQRRRWLLRRHQQARRQRRRRRMR
jgi:hypothetical protein